MRLISKFSDYYDIGLSYGIDEDLVYVRKNEDVRITIFEFNRTYSKLVDKLTTTTMFSDRYTPFFAKYREYRNAVLIGACGEFYIAYKVPNKDGGYEYIYSEDALRKYIKRTNAKLKKELINPLLEKIEDYITPGKILEWDQPFIDFDTPLMVISPEMNMGKLILDIDRISGSEGNIVIEKNPVMKDLEFYKIKDSYTMFQAVSMYLTNQLAVSEPDLLKITEPEIISKKGFDPKYGFRTRPKD